METNLQQIYENLDQINSRLASLEKSVKQLRSSEFGLPMVSGSQPTPPHVTSGNQPPETTAVPSRPMAPAWAKKRREALAKQNTARNQTMSDLYANASGKASEADVMAGKRAAYHAKMQKLYSDKARTETIARDLTGLAGGGLVVALSESAEYCQTVTKALNKSLTTAVLTEETPGDIRDGILARAETGKVQVLITTRSVFELELVDPERLDVLYLMTPVLPSPKLIDAICRWQMPQPSKNVSLKFLGREDANIKILRSTVTGRLRDFFGRR
ncbi:uncharacterized protein Dvar_11490 [Desulfosarcina variabilis str. Montpellier]|uniref:hypothetical protein n=1 Tax=Desulfosarcina variabilis TaxID=2300 RepID=UPI003AFA031C